MAKIIIIIRRYFRILTYFAENSVTSKQDYLTFNRNNCLREVYRLSLNFV